MGGEEQMGEAAQREEVIFWWKMGLRCSADNRLLRGTSVSAQIHLFFIYFYEI